MAWSDMRRLAIMHLETTKAGRKLYFACLRAAVRRGDIELQLTDEQATAVDLARIGSPLRIVAYAGAGKTSTLRAIANAAPNRPGLYLAFNKAIAAESAAKFRGTKTDCRTAHSIAYRWAAGQDYSAEKLTRRPDLRSIAGLPVSREYADRPTAGRRLALATVRRWMQTDDPFVSQHHVPEHIADMTERMGVVHIAIGLWREMTNRASSIPLGHDGYLKLWALSQPQLLADVVYVDEAQDLNPVLIGVLANQRRQIISVGDPHQQIYAWRGAVDALRILPGQETRLTQSFRFGGEIAETADGLLRAMHETSPLRGNGRAGFVGPEDGEPDAILCRTNAGVFSAAADNPGCSIAGGVAELTALIADIERLQTGREAIGADLMSFGDWSEVVEAVEADEGCSLAPIVRIVERQGVGYLRRVISSVSDCGLPCIGTGHKTKGLEWPHVAVADDFRQDSPSLEERRLFYVALTRAQFEVNVSPDVLSGYLARWEEDDNECND